MPRPIPTPVMHFTRVEHLSSIIRNGLLSDILAQRSGRLTIEIGHHDIKERRRRRKVDTSTGGVVADYVPFYFAPRSPMMFVLDRGTVASYQEGFDRVVYLVSTVERVTALGRDAAVSDRNAVLAHASITDLSNTDLDHAVDWNLMHAKYWNNTADEPDRKERRMAECLVHGLVPWTAFLEVVAKNAVTADEARAVILGAGQATRVTVRPSWYF